MEYDEPSADGYSNRKLRLFCHPLQPFKDREHGVLFAFLAPNMYLLKGNIPIKVFCVVPIKNIVPVEKEYYSDAEGIPEKFEHNDI